VGSSRKLDPGYKKNPVGLTDGLPGYEIGILHVPPDPPPEGAKQLWQVAKCTVTTVDLQCKKQEQTVWIIDIVKLGGRKEIPDKLSLDYPDKYCLVIEKCEFTVGFDGGQNYQGYSSEKVTEKLATRLLKEMTEPKTTYTTVYAFRSKNKACDDCEKTEDPFGLEPGEEALIVDGIGEYLPERLKKKKKEEEEKKEAEQKKKQGDKPKAPSEKTPGDGAQPGGDKNKSEGEK